MSSFFLCYCWWDGRCHLIPLSHTTRIQQFHCLSLYESDFSQLSDVFKMVFTTWNSSELFVFVLILFDYANAKDAIPLFVRLAMQLRNSSFESPNTLQDVNILKDQKYRSKGNIFGTGHNSLSILCVTID